MQTFRFQHIRKRRNTLRHLHIGALNVQDILDGVFHATTLSVVDIHWTEATTESRAAKILLVMEDHWSTATMRNACTVQDWKGNQWLTWVDPAMLLFLLLQPTSRR
jgi:hypothetical protein